MLFVAVVNEFSELTVGLNKIISTDNETDVNYQRACLWHAIVDGSNLRSCYHSHWHQKSILHSSHMRTWELFCNTQPRFTKLQNVSPRTENACRSTVGISSTEISHLWAIHSDSDAADGLSKAVTPAWICQIDPCRGILRSALLSKSLSQVCESTAFAPLDSSLSSWSNWILINILSIGVSSFGLLTVSLQGSSCRRLLKILSQNFLNAHWRKKMRFVFLGKWQLITTSLLTAVIHGPYMSTFGRNFETNEFSGLDLSAS